MMLDLPQLPPHVAAHASAAALCSGGAPRVLLVADMSQPSLARRFWAFDLSDPTHPTLVLQTQVANGYGSDPGKTGIPTTFGDVEGSGKTSLGAYVVGEPYVGKHGGSYRLAGVSSTNAHAFERQIMLHPAPYVSATHVGTSAGCAAVAPETLTALDRRFGSLSGSVLWIDGPGAIAPTCAAATQPVWPVHTPTWIAALAPSRPACDAGVSATNERTIA